MIKAIRPATAANLEEEDAPVLNNPAVAHCAEVWKTTRQQSLANGKPEYKALQDAALAYCAAMPLLSGHQNISDFIACVGYSLAIEIISKDRAATLLSAARIAHSTTMKEPKEAKKQATAA
jgi:hypothetical protein